MSRLITAVALALVCGFSYGAEVYKWVDEEGNVNFGDCPPTECKSDRVEIHSAPSPERAEETRKRTKALNEFLRGAEEQPGKTAPPNRVPGSTQATLGLQRDLLRLMWLVDSAKDPTCSRRRILDTKVVKVKTGPKASVVECWRLERCGKSIEYFVEFTSSPQGGTYFHLKDSP